MTRFRKLFPEIALRWSGAAFLGIVVLSLGCERKDPEREARADQSGQSKASEDAVHVETVMPRPGGLQLSVIQPGTVRAFEWADLYAKVSGFLKEQSVDIGDHVKEGQVLAVLYVPELQKAVDESAADLARAKARVELMQAGVNTAQASFKAAKAAVVESRATIKRQEAAHDYHSKEYRRMKELAADKAIDVRLVDEKQQQYLSSESAVDAANAAVVTAQAQADMANAKIEQARAEVHDAEASVQVAEAALAKARVMFEYTKIASPYNGVVTVRNFHRGDFIRPAEEGSQLPLLQVQRTDLMRVVVQVPDLDVPYVKLGDPSVLHVESLPDEEFKGKVARFADSEDHHTRLMRTEIDTPNPNGRLRDGMYGLATIKIQDERRKDAITIPASALIGKTQDHQGQLYIVRNNKAHLIKIVLGHDNGIRLEVLKGLSPEDVVVATYNGSISDGVPVVVAEQTGSGGNGKKPEKKK